MNKILANCISLGIGLGAIGVAFPAQSASFQGLGDLAGGSFNSIARGVSADGSVVVGSSISANGREAFRWTQATGMVGLGDLPGGDFRSQARAISADGTSIIGTGWSDNSSFALYRWTQATGMVNLSSGDTGAIDPRGVSADGSVIVGYGDRFIGSTLGGASEAFRWTQETGFVGLGVLPGATVFGSIASGVSADGEIIVGRSSFADSVRRAFLWKQETGMVSLGVLPGSNTTDFSSAAAGVSADGSVVVGVSSSDNGTQAFRWTQETGMVGLGDLPGGSFSSEASGVSANGSVVVGSSSGANGGGAFIWNSAQGMRSLQQVLTNDYGLNLTGWTLSEATGISADGLTVVGVGTNPSGNFEAWIARLDGQTNPPNPSVPEPSSILGLGLFSLVGVLIKKWS